MSRIRKVYGESATKSMNASRWRANEADAGRKTQHVGEERRIKVDVYAMDHSRLRRTIRGSVRYQYDRKFNKNSDQAVTNGSMVTTVDGTCRRGDTEIDGYYCVPSLGNQYQHTAVTAPSS